MIVEMLQRLIFLAKKKAGSLKKFLKTKKIH